MGATCIAAGLLLGRGPLRVHCSDPACDAPLTLADRECPRCGGTVAGEITHPDQRLDAEEALAAGKDQGHA